jgi:type I restriction-modification system DNA methylase subunit
MSDSKASARAAIEKLVRYFEQNIHQLKAPNFNEAQARQLLIDPFFEALGWDVRNRAMAPPFRLEVLPEGRVKTSIGKGGKEQDSLFPAGAGVKEEMQEYSSMLEYIADDEYKAEHKMASKKPDYRFRIQGSTKFFVEAKKPSVDLTNHDAVFQIKRYGFSARVPVSILTDFEEFRVFDCTRKPFYDKPKVGVLREFDLAYTSYLEAFELLYGTFSREAVVGGSIEALQKKYLEKKKGEFGLDRAFLDDLSEWRVELARDIAKHPKNRRVLNTYTLNECVQRILDRIVFLRVCQDRNIDPDEELLALIRLWDSHTGLSLYEMFNQLIEKKRPLYNGLLFAEHECEQLEVGNKILEKIFKSINYPLSPYNFSEIGVEILGSIYERFLGKTIRLTQKQIRVEEKPEVRKAGGVYYTPQYIVNYIVENTVGRLLYDLTPSPSPDRRGVSEGRGEVGKMKLTPKQVAKLKIIDIACGSGSFLLGAFQKLIDYHEQWYTHHPDDIREVHGVRDAYEDALGRLVLSARKKREILVNNIYGVDIDPQAVEVTQMSLYLKVLEDENDATLNKPTMLALHEVLLPPLKNNIKCGNSLIGTDIGAQGDLFDSDTTHKINPFDWQTEFKEIMDAGGFDCVIGNPPWGAEFDEIQLDYLRQSNKEIVVRMIDSFMYFVYKGSAILRSGGFFGMILPDVILYQKDNLKLRNYLLENFSLTSIINLGNGVFEQVTRPTCIVTFRNSKPKKNEVNVIDLSSGCERLKENDIVFSSITQSKFSELPDSLLITSALRDYDILTSLKRSPTKKLEELVDEDGIQRGVSPDLKEAFIVDDAMIRKFRLEKSILRPVVTGGKQIKRYGPPRSEGFVIYTDRETDLKDIPHVCKFIDRFKLKITCSEVKEGKHSVYSLHRAREERLFLKEKKILGVITEDEIKVTIDSEKLFATDGIYLFATKGTAPEYLLGILNSKLFVFVYRLLSLESGRVLAQVKPTVIAQLPIRVINFTKSDEKKMHDDLVKLVEKMLDLHKQLQKASFDSEKEPIERQIESTDRKIDEMVYKLYELTEDEIAIVEDSTRRVEGRATEESGVEQKWKEAFASTQKKLEELAGKALKEYKSGKTRKMGFDEL